jgi:hypothetical protein
VCVGLCVCARPCVCKEVKAVSVLKQNAVKCIWGEVVKFHICLISTLHCGEKYMTLSAQKLKMRSARSSDPATVRRAETRSKLVANHQ